VLKQESMEKRLAKNVGFRYIVLINRGGKCQEGRKENRKHSMRHYVR
jgi:hypothetical protein